jgi:mannose-6-phosphate isomerase-like protein (cupin superfamily)
MRNQRSMWVVLAVTAFSAVVVRGQVATWKPADAAGQGQDPIMPVHQEPHHRQVFQHGPMRLLDLQVPPGDVSWFHTHEWPVYYLTTSDSPTVSQNLGEEWGAGRRGGGAGRAGAPGGAGRAGAPPTAPPQAAATPAAPPQAAPQAGARPGGPGRGRPRLMSDLSYAERPNTHRIRNDGTGLFRAMVVVNETQGGDESVTEEAAGFAAKSISSNKWFRAYRIALGPGEKTAAHQHKAPVVILQDTSGKGLAAGGMKFEFNEPGQWAFYDAGDRHEISNTGGERLELIEVEVRRR